MDTLVGNVVRLEPLATRHSQELFDGLGNDDEAWRWMIVPTPRSWIFHDTIEPLKSAAQSMRVTLKTDADNKRSQAAIARIGAKYEGTLRSHRMRADGTSRDSMYYSILSSEWPQVKATLQGALS